MLTGSDQPQIIKTPEHLECLRSCWVPLQWNPYYDLDYLIWKCGQPWSLDVPHVFIFNSPSCPGAIVVGEKRLMPFQFQLGYKRWTGPSLNTLYIHRYGILGDMSSEIWEALERHLEDLLLRGEFEAVLMRDFEPSLPPHTLVFPRLPGPCKMKTSLLQEHWLLDARGGLTSHKARHKAFWHNVKNRGNRILRSFGNKVEIQEYLSIQDLDELLHRTEDISCKTWQRRLGGLDFHSLEMRERYRYMMEKGLFRGRVLTLEEKPASFFHGIEYGGNFFAEVMGYDPVFSNLGVGTYLTGKGIEAFLLEDTGGWMDFGVGNSEAKIHFCDRFFWAADRFLVAPGPRLAALNALRVAFLTAHMALKKALSKGGLYHKIRSAWRYGLGKGSKRSV